MFLLRHMSTICYGSNRVHLSGENVGSIVKYNTTQHMKAISHEVRYYNPSRTIYTTMCMFAGSYLLHNICLVHHYKKVMRISLHFLKYFERNLGQVPHT